MRLIDADELIRIWNGCELTGSIAPIVNARPTVDAWKFVYEELAKNEMLCGKYDARTSDAEHFMNGVWTVMEYIAERAGQHDEFDEMFVQNLKDSEERAERRMLEKAYEATERG